jgi:hypothetical protein
VQAKHISDVSPRTISPCMPYSHHRKCSSLTNVEASVSTSTFPRCHISCTIEPDNEAESASRTPDLSHHACPPPATTHAMIQRHVLLYKRRSPRPRTYILRHGRSCRLASLYQHRWCVPCLGRGGGIGFIVQLVVAPVPPLHQPTERAGACMAHGRASMRAAQAPGLAAA